MDTKQRNKLTITEGTFFHRVNYACGVLPAQYAMFTDKEDAELFCLIPELIQLLKRQRHYGSDDSEYERLEEIQHKFDPDFSKRPRSPSPSPDVPSVRGRSGSQDLSPYDLALRHRQFHTQGGPLCGDGTLDQGRDLPF